MTYYLNDVPLEEAKQRFETALKEEDLWRTLGVEEVEINENLVGRVLAKPVWARLSYPHYHSSAMDGFALRADDILIAKLNNPVELEIKPERVQYVDTGDPLPDWADLVIPIEQVEPYDSPGIIAKNPRKPKTILIRKAFSPWSHIRHMGEDIVATQLVLPSGHVLRPIDLGAIAASGNVSIYVYRRPRVAIIPTGDELVEIGQAVKPGDIIEFNSIVLAGQIQTWGGLSKRFSIVVDDLDSLCEVVQKAANEYDLILLNAGSSAGSEDYSSKVVERLGKLLVHGIAVRPGHPVILGMVNKVFGDNKIDRMVPIIGVPGYPVSAALTGEIFVKDLLQMWQALPCERINDVEAELTKRITSPAGSDDYVRVVLGKVNEKIIAAPLAKGAGVITSMVKADGIAVIPRGIQVKEAGEKIRIKPFGEINGLEKTIFIIGSHDVSLDVLAQYMSLHDRRVVSSNVGSLGGLIALNKKESHMSGTHLLDPEAGDYNISYIKKYIKNVSVRVMVWVERQQGLIIKKGNPKNIKDLFDLNREDITFINRQSGSGTRVLLDYHLEKNKINIKNIVGYDQEEFTHLAVAADVSSGRADCGLGIAAAAKALDLDFVPLFIERYDFVIPTNYYDGPLIAPLFDIMCNNSFKNDIQALPGYNTNRMGDIIGDF